MAKTALQATTQLRPTINFDPNTVYQPGIGSHVKGTIETCIGYAKHFNQNITFNFNDAVVTVTPETTPEQAYTDWDNAMNAKAAAWEASPEGQAYRVKEAARKAKVLKQANDVMKDFDSVNWNNVDEVLAFLDKTVEPFDYTYVTELGYGQKVNAKLQEAGYVSKANCGDQFNGEDKDNFARYLIGQAMSCFDWVGCIHHVYSGMYNDYKVKFSV